MSDIIIRAGEKKDFQRVLNLIKDLARFEKAPEKVTNTVEQMECESNLFRLFVAENSKGEIVGFALCFFAYFTWVGKSLYLDDLYVVPEYRRRKVASRLMKEIFKLAQQENCKRLRWQVLNWNKDAIEMYKVIGANMDDEWLNCDFDSEGIFKYQMH